MARAPRAPQTPGTTSTDATVGADQTAESSASGATDGQGADVVTEVPAKGAKKAGKGALTAADYAKMHSSEVDAKTLARSVLCSDGWVCPDRPPVAPRA